MLKERFQEIVSYIAKSDWQEVFRLLRTAFEHEHAHTPGQERIIIGLDYNWSIQYEKVDSEPSEAIGLLSMLDEEQLFRLSEISVRPVISYISEEGDKRYFGFDESYYSGNKQALWRELRYRLDGNEEIHAIRREELYAGATLCETGRGKATVIQSSDNYLTLMLDDGTKGICLECNKEYMQKALPGIEAGLWYDHEEFPALWSWLHIEKHTDGKPQEWYNRHHYTKEELEGKGKEVLYDNSDIDRKLPIVTLAALGERSATITVKERRKNETLIKEIVLDKPNCTVEIWRKGPTYLTARLVVFEPSKEGLSALISEKAVPAGSILTLSGGPLEEEQTHRIYECGNSIDIPDSEDSTGHRIYPWGFIDGKMILGEEWNPNDSHAKFIGLLELGKKRDIRLGNDTVTVCWSILPTSFAVNEGTLTSIPDRESITIPDGAAVLGNESLLCAPSLRQLTIPASVEEFSIAISRYNGATRKKLDIYFEGSIQQWFDRSHDIAQCIDRLFIQGEEIHIYGCEELVIPEGVSRIGRDMFKKCGTIRSVVLPPQVTEIGEGAFWDCKNLRSVRIMGAASIGASAFFSCKSLEEIYLADGVVSLGRCCFDYLTNVESIFIPASVTEVGRTICSQNDGYSKVPVFLCEAKSRPEGWHKDWHLAYTDMRFGYGTGHDSFHSVKWGQKRK